jgi:hypothetical protein
MRPLVQAQWGARVTSLRHVDKADQTERLKTHAMLKQLTSSAILGVTLVAASAPHAQTAGKAPCGSFRKLSDGKWIVTKQLKIENGGATAILNSGMVISPGFRSAGADIYAALEKSCQ